MAYVIQIYTPIGRENKLLVKYSKKYLCRCWCLRFVFIRNISEHWRTRQVRWVMTHLNTVTSLCCVRKLTNVNKCNTDNLESRLNENLYCCNILTTWIDWFTAGIMGSTMLATSSWFSAAVERLLRVVFVGVQIFKPFACKKINVCKLLHMKSIQEPMPEPWIIKLGVN